MEVKLNSDSPYLEIFAKFILKINNIKDYVIVEKFTNPGIIFCRENTMISVNDLILGCYPILVRENDLFRFVMFDITLDTISNRLVTNYEQHLDKVLDREDLYENICRQFSEMYKIHKLPSGKNQELIALYRAKGEELPSVFMGAVLGKVILGAIKPEDLHIETVPSGVLTEVSLGMLGNYTKMINSLKS